MTQINSSTNTKYTTIKRQNSTSERQSLLPQSQTHPFNPTSQNTCINRFCSVQKENNSAHLCTELKETYVKFEKEVDQINSLQRKLPFVSSTSLRVTMTVFLKQLKQSAFSYKTRVEVCFKKLPSEESRVDFLLQECNKNFRMRNDFLLLLTNKERNMLYKKLRIGS